MSFKEFIKRILMNYFIIVTGITMATAILGTIYDTSNKFGYEAFYSPIIIGIVAILPSFVLYSKTELSFHNMIFRRILHFIVVEIALIGFGTIVGLLQSINVTLSFAFSVLLIYLFVNLIMWIIDSKTANELNAGLKNIQKN